jgi:carbon storage regulator
MLILVRKVQQGIWIEGDIWVKVLSVDRDRVKLGITAPGDVKVMRQELCVDIENAGDAANGHHESPAGSVPRDEEPS